MNTVTNIFFVLIFATTTLFTNSCVQESNSFKDIRDGHIYKTIRIGKQIWMAENLAYKTNVGSWAFNNKEDNVATYGRLYNWKAATKACPAGWHLPSDAEWTILENTLGRSENVGNKLKSTSNLWISFNKNANNKSGFSAIPAGFLDGRDSLFFEIGIAAFFWSATPYESDYAWYRFLDSKNSKLTRDFYRRSHGSSVRCIKD